MNSQSYIKSTHLSNQAIIKRLKPHLWQMLARFMQICNRESKKDSQRSNDLFHALLQQMKLSRIKSAKANLMPVRQQYIILQKQQLRQKTRQLISRPSSAQAGTNKKSIAVVTNASQSNAVVQPLTPYHSRIVSQSYLYESQHSPRLRPFSHLTPRCHDLHSPLSIIRTRSKCQSVQLSSKMFSNSPNTKKKTQFLQKGTGIDKAIIANILKSKMNRNVCASGHGYCDLPQNNELVNKISKQIPKGIRDIVGAEEMLRMKHIFTGLQLKYVSLNQQVSKVMNDLKTTARNRRRSEDEQSITLRSIERW